jgi:hypothetical protein
MNTLAHVPLASTNHTWWRHVHACGSDRLKHMAGDVKHLHMSLPASQSKFKYVYFVFHMHVVSFIHNQMIKKINLVLITYQTCNFFSKKINHLDDCI